MDTLETLKHVYRAAGGKLPARYSQNDGSPKGDCMVDIKPILKGKDKGQLFGDLEKLKASGHVTFRADLRLVALTPLGVKVITDEHEAKVKAEADKAAKAAAAEPKPA